MTRGILNSKQLFICRHFNPQNKYLPAIFLFYDHPQIIFYLYYTHGQLITIHEKYL